MHASLQLRASWHEMHMSGKQRLCFPTHVLLQRTANCTANCTSQPRQGVCTQGRDMKESYRGKQQATLQGAV
jgi:hypothetical protein